MSFRLDQILTLLYDPRTLRFILWGGFAAMAIYLLVLMVTRLGQSNPLRNCVILSVLVHALMAGFAGTVRIDSMISGFSEETVVTSVTIDSFSEGGSGEDQAAEAEADYRGGNGFANSSAPTPDSTKLEPSAARPESDLQRTTANDTGLALANPDLPAAKFTEFSSPQPAKIAEADPVRPEQPADGTESPDAPTASRRQGPIAATPRQPPLSPAAAAAQAATSRETKQADKNGVPSQLLEQPDLPPQLADVPVVDAPAPLLLANTDRGGRTSSPTDADIGYDEALQSEAPQSEQTSSSRTGRSTAGGGASVQSLIDGSGLGELADVAPPPSLERGSPRERQGGEHSVPEIYHARTSPDRPAVTTARGGDQQTESSVQAALAWLAGVQSEDGRWDADQFGAGREGKVLGRDRKGAGADGDMAVTGLALLAFLGAGHTHLEGDYQDTVRRGLQFLIASQGRDGNLGGEAKIYAFMYCHGMSAFALSEAYGMTQDPRLERSVRKAISYTLSAQHPSNGGWRYKVGDPQGDTSQLGWQLMALKSAELGGIAIPAKSREGMVRFLKSVASGTHGGLASYRPKEKATRTMTAEALVCRQFLGMNRLNPASDEAGDFILRELPGEGESNFYYWYYGTLATIHLQGDHWQQWNQALKETLLRLQRSEGDESGSWDPDPVWGKHGGRIYSTALGALCLEVYYRYLPLYSQSPQPLQLK